MKTEIILKLKEIEKNENVKIIFAIESGSRAWRFESPDSDYDVRFVYVRKKSDYLRIDSLPDVLEYEITDDLDIVGWDLKKALFLLKKSNPSLFEWINSPIVYIETDLFHDFKELAGDFYSQKTLAYHYYSMSKSNYVKHVFDKEEVNLKKYFYVLRELLACKYVLYEDANPPMKFDDLLFMYQKELDLVLIKDLLRKKHESKEKNHINTLSKLNSYILKELKELSYQLSKMTVKENSFEQLNEFLMKGIDWYED